MRRNVFIVFLIVSCVGVLLAQRYGGRGGESGIPEDAPVRTAREVPLHSVADFPRWTNAPGFEKDVFTFARVRYKRYPSGWRRGGYCFVDFPDSDLNLSYRLQEVTSLKVDPDGRVLNLTDPELFNYPWVYMVEPGALHFEDDEVQALKKYLLNGGFLMADDFWGSHQWDNFEEEMKRVFPDRAFIELKMDHPIFRSVFDLSGFRKNDLQVPNYRTIERNQGTGVTWEYHEGEACRDVHLRALFDDRGRMMVIAFTSRP